MFFRQKEIGLASPEGTWFPSWPLFSSLLLHGLMAYFLMTWTFPHPSESIPRVVMVQIVEEKQEKAPVPRTPVPPKPKKVQEIVRPKPEPQSVVPRKEEEAPSPAVFQSAEQRVPEVLQVNEEKMGVEERPKEKWMAKIEPGQWGNPGGPQEVDPVRLGKEDPPMSLTADSGSAKKGIPGSLAGGNPWEKGSGGDARFSGGIEGGMGTVPAKGAKTGSVYFQGEGKGRTDLGSYVGNARMRIEKAKRYPREARRRGWEGKVVLSFQIDQKGEVGEIRLIQSSGYHRLDEEGIATLRRASPFPSPLLIEKEKLVLEVPLLFRLEESR